MGFKLRYGAAGGKLLLVSHKSAICVLVKMAVIDAYSTSPFDGEGEGSAPSGLPNV